MPRTPTAHPNDARIGKAEVNPPLVAAIEAGDKKLCASLFARAGTDFNQIRERDGWTPLHAAVEANDIDMVKRLLARHADPTLRLPGFPSALDIAVRREDRSAIEEELRDHLAKARDEANPITAFQRPKPIGPAIGLVNDGSFDIFDDNEYKSPKGGDGIISELHILFDDLENEILDWPRSVRDTFLASLKAVIDRARLQALSHDLTEALKGREQWEMREHRFETPEDFIVRVYGDGDPERIKQIGLTQADLRTLNPKLYNALRQWKLEHTLTIELLTQREATDRKVKANPVLASDQRNLNLGALDPTAREAIRLRSTLASRRSRTKAPK